MRTPTTPLQTQWFGLFPVRSPLLRESLSLSLPSVTKMFQFTEFRFSRSIFEKYQLSKRERDGFPHSEIPGSKLCSNSPRLIAGTHVLHRQLIPRHPLHALCNLFFSLLADYLFESKFQKPKRSERSTWSFKTKHNVKKHSLAKGEKDLRKEVIHPHVLVGIPCYDLTPIIGLTLVDTLSRTSWEINFQHYQLSWFDGRCVQNPRTYSPQRCWSAITSDSDFTKSSCRLRSELRLFLEIGSTSRYCIFL